jgi:hypothetical protein
MPVDDPIRRVGTPGVGWRARPDPTLRLGFTGHEDDDVVDRINTNGRLYDRRSVLRYSRGP